MSRAATGEAAPGGDREQAVPRILLVEDNEINQLVAVGLLKRLGYGCDVASDGEQALQLTARRDYDVILMDCRMPRMDGFTATEQLRRREGTTRHTPVVAMTASALAVDRDRCFAAGMDDYLAKPVAADELGAVLRRWLTEPRVVAAPPPADPLLHRLDELAGERTAEELALVAELITSFLDRVPQHLAALGEAVAAADAAAVEDRAHSLGGAAGNIGAAAVADLCRRLEHRGRDGDLTGVRDDLRALAVEVQQVDGRLRTILSGGREPAAHGAADQATVRV